MKVENVLFPLSFLAFFYSNGNAQTQIGKSNEQSWKIRARGVVNAIVFDLDLCFAGLAKGFSCEDLEN